MAGAGVRLFLAGSRLLASQVNTYLMDQTVSRFSDSAARDAAFGGLGQPVLSEGRVCYLDSDNKVYLYDDSAWVEITNLVSPAFTGVPTAPTAAPGTNTTQLATTAFATTADNLKANLASPAFTGTVTIPTPYIIGAVSMTATGTQLNHVVGVTSAIQTQLDTKATTGRAIAMALVFSG